MMSLIISLIKKLLVSLNLNEYRIQMNIMYKTGKWGLDIFEYISTKVGDSCVYFLVYQLCKIPLKNLHILLKYPHKLQGLFLTHVVQ